MDLKSKINFASSQNINSTPRITTVCYTNQVKLDSGGVVNKEQAHITAKDIQKLYAEIAKSIISSLDYSTIIKKIMDQIQLIFQPQNWSLLYIDEEKDELYFVICEGHCADKIKDLRLKVGEGVAGMVAKTGKSLIVKDTAEHSQFNKKIDQISGFNTSSLIAVPISFQGKILGVIELINSVDDNFSDKELEILKTIADFSAIAINNAMVHEKIVFLATHDALTQVYNRAYFDGFHASLGKNAYYGVIVLVDIDNLKIINDKLGHSIGDKTLVKMAEILVKSCRRSDYVFRIGGDEFLVIIANISLDDIDFVTSEIDRKLRGFLENKQLDFSFSFGISFGKIKELNQLIRLADLKMYENKRGNRLR